MYVWRITVVRNSHVLDAQNGELEGTTGKENIKVHPCPSALHRVPLIG